METHEIERWYTINRKAVVYHFAGMYGCDPSAVEEALQDTMVRVLAKPRSFRYNTPDEVERVIWKSIDNRLKRLYNRDIRRRQIEGEYIERSSGE